VKLGTTREPRVAKAGALVALVAWSKVPDLSFQHPSDAPAVLVAVVHPLSE
jgi:hypothetical protein